MAGRPYSGVKAQAETAIAVGFDDDEKTTVDPGAIDSFEEARTVADPPEEHKITETTGAPQIPRSAGNETIDELTIEEQRAKVLTSLPDASLVLTQGPNRGQRIKLDKVAMSVGRSLENDVVIADTSVSRRHLKIEFDGLHFFIQDLGSGNGTIVNGRDEDDRYQLAHRDALELGRTIIAFDCPALAVPRPAIKPPQPRTTAPATVPPRPTAQLRGESHPAFDDVDEEASTIAGQRLPGLNELPMGNGKPLRSPVAAARSSGKNRSLERPQDLVMPRPTPGDGPRPRNTMPSQAVPAPSATPRPSPVRPRRATSIPPPLPRATLPSRPPPIGDEAPTDEGLTRPARPGQFAPSPAIPGPGTTLPPQRMASVAPAAIGPRVVYPTAPQQYMRQAPPSVVSPRPVNMGVVKPADRGGRARLAWIAALVIIAAILGVTLATVLGGGDDKKSVVDNSDNADAGTRAITPDAAPEVTQKNPEIKPLAVDAGAGKTVIPKTEDETLTASGGPVVRGSLATGAELPETTWGTAEDVVESLPARPDIKPLDTNGKAGDSGDDDDGDDDDGDDDDGDAGKTVKPKPPEVDRRELAALQRRIKAAYRDRNFGRAASLAKQASRAAKGRLARSLRSQAGNYSRLGQLLTQANRNDTRTPRVAMSKYLRARAVDARLGNGHRSFINNKLQIVAPRAARSSIAAGDLVGAKRAVDAARGAGDKVQTAGVMRSLENKARVMINAAKKARSGGNDSEAESKLREALRILPSGSPLVREVRGLLSN